MSRESTAKKVFSDVRKLYEAGFKSANKTYSDNDQHISWWKKLSGKASNRKANQPVASQQLNTVRSTPAYKGAATPIDAGRELSQMGTPAANCGDLAALACYIAHTKYHVPADNLAVVGVFTRNKSMGAKGADHAFAVMGPSYSIYAMSQLDDLSIDLVDKHVLYHNVMALDPWANLVCPLDKYPSKAADKMRSWASYGKRVLWVYDLDNNRNFSSEWCSPDGEYLTIFKNAGLRLRTCG